MGEFATRAGPNWNLLQSALYSGLKTFRDPVPEKGSLVSDWLASRAQPRTSIFGEHSQVETLTGQG